MSNYPPGAANDPRAPYNQPDDECENCAVCEDELRDAGKTIAQLEQDLETVVAERDELKNKVTEQQAIIDAQTIAAVARAKRINKQAAKVDEQANELKRIKYMLLTEQTAHQKRIDQSSAAAHVIIEAGVIPGIDYPCRCQECLSVAVSMDDAGYLERVKDRWWLDAQAAESEGE